MGKTPLTNHRKALLKAFRLNPIKIHKSTGIEMRELLFFFNGEETEQSTQFTMQNLFETLEDEISKTNRKLNLIQ
mgnify:FL=1